MIYIEKKKKNKVWLLTEKYFLVPVVQMLDSTIHRINHSPVDKY